MDDAPSAGTSRMVAHAVVEVLQHYQDFMTIGTTHSIVKILPRTGELFRAAGSDEMALSQFRNTHRRTCAPNRIRRSGAAMAPADRRCLSSQVTFLQ
jgi:hypothetical protein